MTRLELWVDPNGAVWLEEERSVSERLELQEASSSLFKDLKIIGADTEFPDEVSTR